MMLELKNVQAGYEDLQVLKGITIEVKEREIVALIGPNGAGKSTVIKSMYNIAAKTAGTIRFQGKTINRLKTHELLAHGIAYVPQGKINFGNLTVEENLHLGRKDLDLEYVFKKFPDLKNQRKNRAHGLSGGQQQMLAVGRALLQKPKLLMLDEPSLGLSPKLQKELFETIQQINDEGTAILIVEQNAKKAIELAHRTYLLEDGKVALQGGKEILKMKEIKEVYLGGRY